MTDVVNVTVVEVPPDDPVYVDVITYAVGVPGPPGSSATTSAYKWRTNTASSDPGSGFIKANNATATAYTAVYISVYDQDGKALLELNTMATGDSLYLYEAGEIGTWNRYTLTAAPTLTGSPAAWATIPVVYAATGPSPFTPAANQDIVLLAEHAAGGGDVADWSYRHVQGVPLATWTINHNLGFRPAVTTLVNFGTLQEARGAISHTNVNTTVVTFATAVTGEALLS